MTEQEHPALELTGIRAGYGGAEVLHGVDFTVAAGEVVTLLGRNGTGKSTTVSTIMGSLRPSGGRIALWGRDMTASSAPSRFASGLRTVRQTQPVFGGMTVRENLALVGCKDVRRAADVFAFLAGRSRQAAGTLSGGEQKMLALARTAVEPGRLWVLDEPTEGLQPANVDRCADLITTVAREREVAVLLVEQHLDMALQASSRWYVLDRGVVVEQGKSAPDSRAVIERHLTV